MATFYILAENGDRLLTEDGNDLLVKEDHVPQTAFPHYFVFITKLKRRLRAKRR